jgi:hypothetical protein
VKAFKTTECWSVATVVLDVAKGWRHVAVDVTNPAVCSLATQTAVPRSRHRQDFVNVVAPAEILADGETVAVVGLLVSEFLCL